MSLSVILNGQTTISDCECRAFMTFLLAAPLCRSVAQSWHEQPPLNVAGRHPRDTYMLALSHRNLVREQKACGFRCLSDAGWRHWWQLRVYGNFALQLACMTRLHVNTCDPWHCYYCAHDLGSFRFVFRNLSDSIVSYWNEVCQMGLIEA